MNTTARLALALVLAATFTFAVLAQTTAPTPAGDPGAPPAPQVRSSGGVEYLSGGAGEESRAAIESARAGFPLRLVFSVASGAYVVAEHVDVSNAQGKVLGVDDAGPMLLVKVPPGDYTVDARYGGRTERRTVRVGR